jgi:alkanesulfonate monooxygenase SsuD/methylene tetrahydromethanopterin reductase-like flavin-dependent oxidoreductase (luciferase family)
VLGVGYGWNEDEMESHGVTFGTRRALVREKMLAMEALWANDVASYAGERVRIAPSWSWPKPVQRPRPPVLIGGAAGPKLFADIAEWGDGWMPIGGGAVRESLPRLRAAMEERGRDPASLHVVPIGVLPSPEKLEHYAKIGVTEVALRLPSAPRDAVLRQLDGYARYVARG